MVTVMIIGGMGSGKSTVSRLLEKRGAFRLDLDDLGHRVLEDPVIIGQLAKAFGSEIVGEDGAICRPALADAAFKTRETAGILSSITHPAIVRLAQRLLAEAQGRGCCSAVVEVSAFNGMSGPFMELASGCSGIVAVTAPEGIRMERAMGRGFSEQDVRARMASQPTDGQRAEWASDIVENDGSLEDLDAKVGLLWEKYFA